MNNPTVETLVFHALNAVALQCDRASSEDGVGFSKFDAHFARDLLEKGRRFGWSEKQHAAGKKLAHKYRRQLLVLDGNHSVEAVLNEPAPAKASKVEQGPMTLEIQVLRSTDRAHYIEVLPVKGTFGRRQWVPRSVVTFDAGAAADQTPVWAEFAGWFAHKEGLASV